MHNQPTPRTSAQIILLPTAAVAPVVQHPRRGRYPKFVTNICKARYARYWQLQAAKAMHITSPAEALRKIKSHEETIEAMRERMEELRCIAIVLTAQEARHV